MITKNVKKHLGLLAASVFFATGAWAEFASEMRPAVVRPKQFIIGFVPGISYEEQVRLCGKFGIPAKEYIQELDMVVAAAPNGMFQAQSFASMQSDPKVKYIEEDFYTKWIEETPLSFAQTPMVSGANMGRLHEIVSGALKLREKRLEELGGRGPGGAPVNENDHIQWGIARVRAPQVWNRTQGKSVKVAVIDTGIDCSHPDLTCARDGNGRIFGYNAIDPNSPPSDDQGHGTHVSGTIAGHMNGKYVGVAPLAELVPVKVLDSSGNGTLSGVIKGIVWAARNNATLANMSLGAPSGSFFMRAAIMYAHYVKGMTIVAAAGNSGKTGVSYPGAYPEVIAVAASNNKDELAFFSSRGPEIAFVAPGVDVWSTVPAASYAMHSGTSMATPHVTGLAVVALTQGAQGPEGVRQALARAATPLGLGKESEGAGMIDAERLVH